MNENTSHRPPAGAGKNASLRTRWCRRSAVVPMKDGPRAVYVCLHCQRRAVLVVAAVESGMAECASCGAGFLDLLEVEE